MEITAIFLMFALGLRHGIDPDHIAVIDGLSMRYSVTNPKLTSWVGTLFAFGHGSTVTAIAVAISLFNWNWQIDASVLNVLEWIPGMLLILVGIANFYQLRKPDRFKPLGLKVFFIPKRLRESSSPFAVIMLGVCFALVFDTTTQAAAWAYTATGEKSTLTAFLLGSIFSLGMIFTDTLDSRILSGLIRQSERLENRAGERIIRYRRGLGWIIVMLSLFVGSYQLISKTLPSMALEEVTLTALGLVFFSMIIVFYLFVIYNNRKPT
ncbi:hypothetical protein [Pedobacter panaciterrae]|uniref:HoxN/HupN/NixA family nickel/cobalt transporter n=1 Tax=Pedobacter panaciterrae TaxID=363849 RepID=UPI002598F6BF|nr:hypothetical protein [uncultured Pedobacter sp.]